MEGGYLKLYRSMTDWEWYQDPTTKVLFIHLLLTASYKGYRYCGKDVPAGARACTLQKLGDECGLSVHQVRGALERMKASGEIEAQAHSHFTIIKLNNWDKYQADSDEKPKKTKGKNRVPKIHQERFGDDYDAYIKWWHETTGE